MNHSEMATFLRSVGDHKTALLYDAMAGKARAAGARQKSADRAKRRASKPQPPLDVRLALFKAKRAREAEQVRRDAAKVKAEATRVRNLSSDLVWPMEKQRRSRVDWFKVLGDNWAAKRQVAWERCGTAAALRMAGHTWAQVGARFGVGGDAAKQMVAAASKPSPAARFLERNADATHETSKRQAKAITASIPAVIAAANKPRRDWLRLS